MRKFIFRYENILKIRIDKENDIMNNLAKFIKELKLLEEELNRIKDEENQFALQIEKRLEQGCTLEELRRYENNKEWMKSEIESILLYVTAKENEIVQTRRDLIEATKQKKIMEKLRERDYEDYQQEIRAAEDKLTDQIVTYQNRSK